MSFEKNTVDFLKEYFIRYKKILYGFFAIIMFIITKNLYNRYSFWSFNQHLIKTEKAIENNGIAHLNQFFNKNFSHIIGHRTIFVMNYTYGNGIKLLTKKFHNDKTIVQLINQGKWMEIKQLNDVKNDKDILNLLNNLEKIYQFTLKKVPYNCVLNAKHIHHHGELLNVLVFIHITEREKSEVITKFFHEACLHISVYKTYTKFLFYKSVHPQSSMDMDIYNDNTKGNLLKKFINF